MCIFAQNFNLKLDKMWSSIWTYISNHYPMILIIIALVVIVWKAAEKWFNFQKDIEEVKKNNGENETKINDCEAQIGNINDALKKMQEDITIIRTHLIEKDSKTAKLFSGKASPRKLNEMGLKVYKDFGGANFLNNNQKILFDMIDEKEPQTALDVENAALEVLYKCVDNNIFNDVKVLVYQSKAIIIEEKGKEPMEYAITMNDICFIFSIELRDRYLTEHPNVRQE